MASLIQTVDSGILVLASDFMKNFEEGLTSVEIILKTLSDTNLETKDKFMFATLASSSEKHFNEAGKKLEAINGYFQNELCTLIESKKALSENIDDLAQSIKEEERNIEKFRNQLEQSEKEKDIAERKLEDTLEELMNLERQKNSIPLRAAASGTVGFLVGSLLLGPVGGVLAAGINGAVAVAEINSLKRKSDEYESLLKSHVATISDSLSKMLEAKSNLSMKVMKMLKLAIEGALSEHLLERNKENCRKIAKIKETLYKFTNSVSRIHAKSKVVSIESQDIYELTSFINPLIELGTAIETVLPGYGISNRLEDLSKQAKTCKMLDSEFSF